MGKDPAHDAPTPRPAGFAGPLRRLLLVLGCISLALGGAVGGVLLQSKLQPPPSSADPAQTGRALLAIDARLKDSAPEDQSADTLIPESVETATPGPAPGASTPLPMAASAERPDEQLALADELILEGNYRAALHELSLLTENAAGLLEARVRLRLGLCQEALGRLHDSQREFSRVVELKPGPDLLDAAILGRARNWARAGRRELATSILFKALLENAHRGSRALRSQVPHQLAILISSRVAPADPSLRPDDPLSDSNLIVPLLTVRPEAVLEQLKDREQQVPDDRVLPASEVAVLQRYSTSPEEIFLVVRTERLPGLELLRRVANTAGWSVQLTEEARLRLQEHTLCPNCVDLPLAMVLDAILEPFELIWTTSQGAILVQRAAQAPQDEIAAYRVRVAERTLRFACAFSPEHPWTVVSSLEMGRVQFLSGSLEGAARNVQKALDLFPRSEFEPIAWFNLGKLQLLQGQHETALRSFHRAVDQMAGHPLEPAAYLYAGRVHLENDAPRDAIQPLTRGLALGEGSPFEARIALELACSYLMLQHYQRANEILMKHRAVMQEVPARDQAAFLSSLIRMQAATEESDRLREGVTLISSLTNLKLSETFGHQWWYLAGIACKATGMVPEEISLLQKCLNTSYPFPLQNRMRFMLLEDAPSQLTSQSEAEIPFTTLAGAGPTRFHALLAEASLDYRRGDLQGALELCEQLLGYDGVPVEPRREALRLMGHVYQARGQYDRAVQCFTGQMPNKLPAAGDSTLEPSAATPSGGESQR